MNYKITSWLNTWTLSEGLLCFAFLLTHVVVYFFILADASFFGDESQYDRMAELMVRLVDAHPVQRNSIIYHLVGAGYFMPFYSLFIFPLKYIGFSDGTIRGVFLFLNICLSFGIVSLIRRYFGRLASLFLLAFLSIFPTVLLFDSTIFPEAIAGKLVLFVALYFYQFMVEGFNWKNSMKFTLFAVLLVLFRQSSIFIFVGLGLYYLFDRLDMKRPLPSLVELSKFFIPSALIITLAVLWWSSVLTNKFGPGYLTTTSTDLSFMLLWGEGIADLGNPAYPSVWRRLNEHYTIQSRQQQITFKEAVSKDKQKVWKELTFKRYLSGLKKNLINFMSIKGSKIRFIIRNASVPHMNKWIDPLQYWNVILCVLILLSIGLLFLFPGIIPLSRKKLVGLLLFITPFLLIHVFVARANSRHGMILWWTLAAISSVILASLVGHKRQSVATAESRGTKMNLPEHTTFLQTNGKSYLISIYSILIFVVGLLFVCLFG